MTAPENTRTALVLWDFDHSKKRQKVYVDDRWQHECQCGRVFQAMQAWEDHRFDEGVKLIERLLTNGSTA